ncbi:hypothetical protein BH10BDE1_BH10BDE1_32010 [soil metagenome]
MQNSTGVSIPGTAQKLVELLDEKNQYLEKFFELNETELHCFADGNFDNVESFYQSREKILDIVRCIDALVDDEVTGIADSMVTAGIRAEIQDLMDHKDRMAKEILAQDLKLLAAIEDEKSNIIRELKSTKQSRKLVSAYHSGQKSRQLDEEA